MIPWWGWLVIWVCLALALLAMLAVSAVRLFQKGVAVLDELESLALKAEQLEEVAEDTERVRNELAILRGAEEVRRSRALVREAAVERRALRHDARLERARRITRVDAGSREWFKAD